MLLFQPDLGPDAPLLPTLEAASALTERVAVVDAQQIGAVQAGPLGLRAHVPDAAILNGRPGSDAYRAPKPVEAAGGYVMRLGAAGPDVLLIFRRGVWDLPKGKRDGGETVRACAAREVREEVGVAKLRVARALGTTLHGYPLTKRYAVKTTHWFAMTTEQSAFTPQAEEDIEQVAWVPLAEVPDRLGFDTLRAHARLVSPLLERLVS
jgi:8-oxo-dGTP pyrophosphatase MutT (NUDIX family)